MIDTSCMTMMVVAEMFNMVAIDDSIGICT